MDRVRKRQPKEGATTWFNGSWEDVREKGRERPTLVHFWAVSCGVCKENMARLHELTRDYPCIGELRGKGLMIGMELVEADAERTPARALCDAVVTRAFHNGLLLLSCGTSTVRFMPPLSVSTGEIDEAMVLLRASLDQALAGR